MPIYGTEVTISNRALRVEDSGRRECSALLPKDLFTAVLGGEVIMAKASFSSGELTGGIYFIQRDYGGGVLGNTYIIVDLYYREGTMSITTGHNWHVHQNPPLNQGQNCASEIGPHFNPFGVSLANTDDTMTTPSANSNYREDCSPQYPLRCESGDLSNKHGKLQISAAVQNRKTYTYVDNNLALTSNYSIVGRSIGIHRPTSEGGDLFDCAEVERTYPADSTLVTVTLGETSTEVVEGVVAGSTVPPGCVLALSQVAGADGVTATTLRVFGESETAANSNRDQLAGGAVRTTAPMLLMTATYLIVTMAICGAF